MSYSDSTSSNLHECYSSDNPTSIIDMAESCSAQDLDEASTLLEEKNDMFSQRLSSPPSCTVQSENRVTTDVAYSSASIPIRPERCITISSKAAETAAEPSAKAKFMSSGPRITGFTRSNTLSCSRGASPSR